ncbi:MAG: RluA family pseudouridine synthase [Planctomycetaceae bacterium]
MQPFTATFTVEKYLHGSRIDTYLTRQFRNYTSWRMQRMVSSGCVRIEDEVVPLSRRVSRGEHVTIRLVEPPDKLHDPEPMPLQIVFEDPWLIVIDKPANLVAHPVSSLQSGTLVNGLQAYLDSQTPVRGLLRPGIVHRLDRMTSGLIVTTKSHTAHRGLGSDFEHRRVSKSYIAVVEGIMQDDSGVIDRPIGRQHNSILMSVDPASRNPKPAITDFEVLKRFERRTLVEVTPRTGRNHQIRVHFAAIGHPLVGDEFYGFEGPTTDSPGDARHALHASFLGFTHPITGVKQEFRSAVPIDLKALLN